MLQQDISHQYQSYISDSSYLQSPIVQKQTVLVKIIYRRNVSSLQFSVDLNYLICFYVACCLQQNTCHYCCKMSEICAESLQISNVLRKIRTYLPGDENSGGTGHETAAVSAAVLQYCHDHSDNDCCSRFQLVHIFLSSVFQLQLLHLLSQNIQQQIMWISSLGLLNLLLLVIFFNNVARELSNTHFLEATEIIYFISISQQASNNHKYTASLKHV